ncbi:HAD family hydrolase [Pigmentiphaga litoralis]|uniref:HAD superfamily hydrolase (TIGR01509 family) n=1 Tax=Pigmentiphaga litoralis TaxID=516702 RepID=A0A7Y9IW65_9BURK|nr:HAD family phosphatase [Pigmentiphaga litoralis]NYE22277.1 HAD superfamily hydrolase (TIGR01509 family) [Pigmentiphaga litoralis]NYE84108.1 HAD superfamily hydrolase (TIGR01509 family) [Pigmentiphaga litoralis]
MTVYLPNPPFAAASSAGLAIDAFVFDMDGLLLNTETLARLALMRAGQALDLPMTEAFCASLIGIAADGSRKLLYDRYGEDAPADDFFSLATREMTAQIDAGALALQPGVEALLDGLDRCSIPRSVATSSGGDKARHHLAAAGILDRFDHIVTRDDVAAGKPRPDLFLEAARRLRKAPGRCLALEDSYNGVRAAHAAGMPVVMVPDLLAPTDEMRETCLAILDSLQQVDDLFVRPAGFGPLAEAPLAGAPLTGARFAAPVTE